MAELTIQNVSRTGTAPTLVTAAAGGDDFFVDSATRTFLVVKNSNGAPRDVTITAQKTPRQVSGVGNLTVPNIVVTVAATTGEAWILVPDAYIGANGKAVVTYSASAGVTVAAVRLEAPAV